ncbi:hypothetical protein T439DRAFT_381253 [Meredithblackwellia eburnea MCA 4105]
MRHSPTATGVGFSSHSDPGLSSAGPDPPVALAAPLWDDTSHLTTNDNFTATTTTITNTVSTSLTVDFSAPGIDFDFLANDFTVATKAPEPQHDLHLPFDLAEGAVAFDAGLMSPLGLENESILSTVKSSVLDDTPFSEFLHSPLFGDDEPSEDGTQDLPLFPTFPPLPPLPVADRVVVTLPKEEEIEKSPLLLDLLSVLDRFPLLPESPLLGMPSPSTVEERPIKPLPARSSSHVVGTASTSSPVCAPPTPASTPALPSLDAPVAARNYLLPSKTSRKRKTSLVEKELAKRQCVPTSTGLETLAKVEEGEIPQDLVDAVERKRLQNTLAARKSRAKKAENERKLTEENEQLARENAKLRAQVELLEQRLKKAIGA